MPEDADSPGKVAGYLQKQAEWRFAWDRRYLALDGLELSNHVEKDSPAKKIGTVTSILRYVDTPESMTFRVWFSEGECWTLRAESVDVHHMWVNSIVNALLKVPSSNTKNICRGEVLKKAEWTGKWQQRYVELERCRMVYREVMKGPVKQRHEIISADVGRDVDEDDELKVTTMSGESFWLKFLTPEQCHEWRNVILRGLRRAWSWYWTTVVPLQPSKCNVRMQFHASASPATRSSDVYCYGGSSHSVFLRYSPVADSYLPTPQRENIRRDFVRLQLGGNHTLTEVNALPFEESKHAKVLPPPLFGAAMCAVQVPLRRDVSTTDNLDVLVTVGGRSETSMIRGSTTEIWWCALLRPQPRWFRSSCSSSILPSRTFHTLTTINLSLAVLTGGIDDNNQPRDECFSISWSTDATTGDKASFLNLVPVVEPISALPCPLAFHACVCLKDSSLLVLGTSYAIGENSPSCSRVLRLVDVGSQWEDVVLKPPLPSMYNTTAKVATVSGVECVFVLGELRMTHRALKLFKIVLTESTSGFLTEIPFSNEFAPQCTYGVSMHISDDFLYVIGGRVCCPIDKDYSFNLLLNEPVRALIGIDEDNTGSDKEE